MKFWGLLLKLDILAPSVQLRIAGNTSSKSFIGVLLFLAYIAISSWACILQYKGFLDTANPDVTTDSRFKDEYPVFDLRGNKTLPIILGTYETVRFADPQELKTFMTLKL